MRRMLGESESPGDLVRAMPETPAVMTTPEEVLAAKDERRRKREEKRASQRSAGMIIWKQN